MRANITTLLKLIWELNRSQVRSSRRYSYDTNAAGGKITISNTEFLVYGKETRCRLVSVWSDRCARFRLGSSAGYRGRNAISIHHPNRRHCTLGILLSSTTGPLTTTSLPPSLRVSCILQRPHSHNTSLQWDFVILFTLNQ